MNMQNYILPVSIAAALHVALLWSGAKEPPREKTTIIEIPLKPLPNTSDDVVVAPVEKSETMRPLQPLADGPMRPSIADSPVIPKPSIFTIPPEDPIKHSTTDLKIIPERFGQGTADTGDPRLAPSGPISFTQLDRIPRATVQPAPDYPNSMHQAGITGLVTVEFEVDTTGRVVRAEAIRSSHHEFAGPAVRAVLQWHFEPGRRNGHLVPFRMAIPIEFSLPAE